MSIPSQAIRYAAKGDTNNPEALYNFVKPMRWIFKAGVPFDDEGQDEWAYVNTSTGDLYIKESGLWVVKYNFDTGGISGIQNIENVGEGVRIFRNISGGTAFLRTLTSEGNEIIISEDDPIAGSIDFKMSEFYKPVTLNKVPNVKCEYGAPVPPTVFQDEGQGYSDGSLWSTLTGNLYICLDPTNNAAVWSQVVGTGGISDIFNVGSGDASVLKDVVDGVASLRSINGTLGQITVSEQENTMQLSIPNTYRPVTLSNILDNKRFGFGSLSAPTVNDDSLAGYAVGSIFTEIEIGGTNRIWLCRSANQGAAIWQEFTGSAVAIPKDYVQWTNDGIAYTQVITGVTQDVNMGVNVTLEAQAPGSHWSTSFDGSRQIFTRGVVTGSPRSYMVSFNCVTLDVSGATAFDSRYVFSMVRKSDGALFQQSVCSMVVVASPQTRHNGTMSASFIIHEPSLSAVSYYLRVHGQNNIGSGAEGVAPNFNFEQWGLSFKEI